MIKFINAMNRSESQVTIKASAHNMPEVIFQINIEVVDFIQGLLPLSGV